jgi:sugar/nucleoside kinase (ribokinase family)
MNERTTLATDLNVFANFKPTLPPAPTRFVEFHFSRQYRSHSAALGAEADKGQAKVVGLDTMNYWIERTPAELRETLKHTQILMINDDETRQLTGEHNLLRAAKKRLQDGPAHAGHQARRARRADGPR